MGELNIEAEVTADAEASVVVVVGVSSREKNDDSGGDISGGSILESAARFSGSGSLISDPS